MTGFAPAHTPAWHASVWVHELPSEHVVPFATLACTHPVAATHESVVQTLLSSQLIAVPTQAPAPLQRSVVQALPSLQAVLVDSNVHADEQQSPFAVLPSSQASVPVFAPSPQTCGTPRIAARMSMSP